MNNLLKRIAFSACLLSVSAVTVCADNLVIVHTNDTHSQIDPNDKNLGGVARRKVLIDSIRNVSNNVLVVDCGDMVQGTPFFNLFKGEVEFRMLDLLGYDYAILGNHEFDNGSEQLAPLVRNANAKFISTNYDLTGPLENLFLPYAIKEAGGKKIGIIGLNLNPKGMIADGNYNGVKYLDAVKAANATAWHLKHNEKADLVVALSHLGYNGTPYPKDIDIIGESEDIDILIGGHSHTFLYPGDKRTFVKNKNGRDILVAQTGKQGMNIGEITVDLDSLGKAPQYNLISVDSRLDGKTDKNIEDIISKYRVSVDSLMAVKIGKSAQVMEQSSPELINFISDFALAKGEELTGEKVDIAFMNKGSLRRALPKGNITLGMILMLQPFNNHLVVMDISGDAILRAFDVMVNRGGDGISKGAYAEMDRQSKTCTKVTLNGEPIDRNKTYRVATIDYLANGGDYMQPLTEGKIVATSKNIVYKDVVDYIGNLKKKTIKASSEDRMRYKD